MRGKRAARLVDDCPRIRPEDEIKRTIVVNIAFYRAAAHIRSRLSDSGCSIGYEKCAPVDDLAAADLVFVKRYRNTLARRNLNFRAGQIDRRDALNLIAILCCGNGLLQGVVLRRTNLDTSLSRLVHLADNRIIPTSKRFWIHSKGIFVSKVIRRIRCERTTINCSIAGVI